MTITNDIRKQVVAGILRLQENFSGSEAQFATRLGINPAILSRIKKGDFERVLSDQKWISLARRAEVNITNAGDWKIAQTPIFTFIMTQLGVCQQKSICSVLCDISDIGKTVAARYYARNNKNAIYIDCSQAKTKLRLIRKIAESFGVDSKGRYFDVYDDLAFYLHTLDRPIIILDEAGDLGYDAFLELKALYNATEYNCSIYMIGADGLKAKWDRAISNKKVGYTEIFSRMGKKYQTIIPTDRRERERLLALTATMIIKANAESGADVSSILRRTMVSAVGTATGNIPSLRRIHTELAKVI